MSPTNLSVADVSTTNEPVFFAATSDTSSEQIDAIAVVYLVVSFLGLAALLQFLGVYREQIRRFNSVFVRRGLQAITQCFSSRFFHHAPNEIVTRVHLNMFELFVRTTIDFFYDAPNLITFTIGLLQVLSTFNPHHPLQTKFVNLIALSINYIYTMVREISMYHVARKFDDSRNFKIYKLISNPESTDEFSGIASKDICKGDLLRLDYGEIFPAECMLLESREKHILINTKEESGEDCSSIFSKGDVVPYGGRVSTQGASLVVSVVATRNSILPEGVSHRRLERFPEHMNKYLTVSNLFALGLLSILAGCSVALVLYVIDSPDEMSGNHLLFIHFFSMVAQLNMLIPSMRWVILYFLYVFLIDLAFANVSIQSHGAIRKLKSSVQAVYTDKTGTLTETEIGVELIDLLPALDELAVLLNADRRLVACVIILACNDTQPGNGEGTSPEEMVLAEHLRRVFQCWIEKNPLKPKSETMKIALNHRIFEFTIVSRSGYIPSEFCRIAEIEAFGHKLVVRQGGSDRMACITGETHVVRSEALAARSNPNRAFGWTVSINNDQGIKGKHFYCVRGTFTNPPRETSEELVKFLKSENIAVRMLTGDALEAAKYIATKVGIISEETTTSSLLVLRQDFESDDEFLSVLQNEKIKTVLIEGSQLVRMLAERSVNELSFMKNPLLNMVIYRTKSADKAVIVRHCSEELEVGCAMIGDAANDKYALALPNIVSVALRHGAAPCRVVADVVITEPCDLIDFWTACQWLHLNGAKALLVNTCMIGAVVSGLTWIGIYRDSFQLLPRGFLYPDPYDTRLMLVFSSMLYAPSACAAVLGRYSNPVGGNTVVKIRSLPVLLGGLGGGLLLGYIWFADWYSMWMLSVMIVTGMASHGLIARRDLFSRPRSGNSDLIAFLIDFVNKGPTRIVIILLYIGVLFLASKIH